MIGKTDRSTALRKKASSANFAAESPVTTHIASGD
jgi:hypothetical protein